MFDKVQAAIAAVLAASVCGCGPLVLEEKIDPMGAEAQELSGPCTPTDHSGCLSFPVSRVYVGYYGSRQEEIEKAMGRRFAMRRVYASTSFGGGDILNGSALSALAGSQIPVVTFKVGTCNGSNSCNDEWKSLVEGRHDGWLAAQREKILADGRRFILGFHHEPEQDGWASLYRKAYAHAYARLNSPTPLPNVRWVFVITSGWALGSSYSDASDPGYAALKGLSKADAYNPEGTSSGGVTVRLDYLAADPYSWCLTSGHGGGSFRSIATPIHNWAAARSKPYLLTETATYRLGTSDERQADWIHRDDSFDPNDMLNSAAGLRVVGDPSAGLKGFMWFDSDHRWEGHCDWRLSDQSVRRFADFAADLERFRTLRGL
ncbi:MAG: hypothetical protein HYZ28_16260 [Myxococcales bacterium]|nr:hypothetical protein [Myxococcales bacterium]